MSAYRVEFDWHGPVAGAVAAAAWNAATARAREADTAPINRVETDPGNGVFVAAVYGNEGEVLAAAKEALEEHRADELPDGPFHVVSVSVEVDGEASAVVEELDA